MQKKSGILEAKLKIKFGEIILRCLTTVPSNETKPVAVLPVLNFTVQIKCGAVEAEK